MNRMAAMITPSTATAVTMLHLVAQVSKAAILVSNPVPGGGGSVFPPEANVD